MKPRLLDLFCGAGGASMGYARAGFEVVGVDLHPQPRYPFEFIQADATTYSLDGFDAVHASPPCQAFSSMTRGRWQEREHPDHVALMRDNFSHWGAPYIIENVPGAPLHNPITLCGTMFGLGVGGAQLRRHRLFECPWFFDLLPECQHNDSERINGRPATVGVWGNAGGYSVRDDLQHYTTEERRQAMGIDWMKGRELSEAIPPAYTEYIGRQLMRQMVTV